MTQEKKTTQPKTPRLQKNTTRNKNQTRKANTTKPNNVKTNNTKAKAKTPRKAPTKVTTANKPSTEQNKSAQTPAKKVNATKSAPKKNNAKNKPKATEKTLAPKHSWFSTLIRRVKKTIKWSFISGLVILLIIIGGFALPDNAVNPVQGATSKDWNPKSFWYYPWGKSGVHRGVDIFAPVGRPVLSATDGVVISTAILKLGGKTVTVLGPKWRIHYYAHLDDVHVRTGQWVDAGELIANVGQTGNAYGKTPHLHYTIRTLFPYVWRRDKTPYGSQKMWYIDPTPRL